MKVLLSLLLSLSHLLFLSLSLALFLPFPTPLHSVSTSAFSICSSIVGRLDFFSFYTFSIKINFHQTFKSRTLRSLSHSEEFLCDPHSLSLSLVQSLSSSYVTFFNLLPVGLIGRRRPFVRSCRAKRNVL